jgi:hypothetical protein
MRSAISGSFELAVRYGPADHRRWPQQIDVPGLNFGEFRIEPAGHADTDQLADDGIRGGLDQQFKGDVIVLHAVLSFSGSWRPLFSDATC